MCEQFKFLTRKKRTIQCFKYRQNQIPEAVGMKHTVLETRKSATEQTQRKSSIISKCLQLKKASGRFYYIVPMS